MESHYLFDSCDRNYYTGNKKLNFRNRSRNHLVKSAALEALNCIIYTAAASLFD